MNTDECKPSRSGAIGAAALTVGLIAGLAGFAWSNQSGTVEPASTYTTNQSVEYLEFAGTVRNVNGVWGPLDDSGHEPDDILSVTNVTSTSIRVNHPLCAQVVSVIVGADNEYAQDFGAQFGPSAGFGFFVIEGSISDGPDAGTADDIWDPTTDYTAGTNIWIMGKCLPA